MKKFFSDFQTFISRGNVIDMAVGVIVGAAFTAIVNSMVKDLINPVLGVLIGSQDFSNFFVVLSMPEGYTGPMSYDALTKAGAAVLGYGAFFTAVFHFLLMAFVVFSLVRCVNKIRAATEAKLLVKKKQEEAQAAVAAKAASQAEVSRVSKEIELLTEIRDLLKKQA